MALQLRRDRFVAAVPSEGAWSFVLEKHGDNHVHVFACFDGEPRGYIRVPTERIATLCESLTWLIPRDGDDE